MNFMENYCPRQMLDFTANMHGIQFRLGFRPRWELTALPQTSQLNLEEGRGGGGKGLRKGRGKGERKREGKGKGKDGSFLLPPRSTDPAYGPGCFCIMLSRIYLSLPQ